MTRTSPLPTAATYPREHPLTLSAFVALLGFSLCAATLLVTGPTAFSTLPLISTLARWFAYLGHFEGYPYLSRDYGLWWSDGHYNLLRAFYILKGRTLYSDVPSSQFPGLHVLYAIALALLGYARARPGPQLVPQIERAGQFVTGTLQILFFAFAARAAGIRLRTGAVAAFGIVWFLWERYGHWIPIIEPVLCPVTTLLTVLIYRAFTDRHPASRRTAGLFLLCIAPWSVILGLTAAPTFVLWTVATGAALVADAFRAPPNSSRLPAFWRGAFIFVAAIICAFLLIVLLNVDLHAMWFWAYRNPKRGLGINVRHNLHQLFTTWPYMALHFGSPAIYEGAPGRSPARNYPLLGALPCILFLLSVLFAAQASVPLPRRTLFSGLVLLGAILLRWRVPDDVFGLKTLPAVGIGFGLCLLLADKAGGRARSPGKVARRAACASAVILFVLGV